MILRNSLLVVAPVDTSAANPAAITCTALSAVCASRGVVVTVGEGKTKLPALGRGPRIVFVAGKVQAQSLLKIVSAIHQRGFKPIVVVDALQVSDAEQHELEVALTVLNEKSFQLAHSGEVPSLLGLNWNDLQMYRFAKADNTASVAVFLEGGKKILVIRRLHNPDQGKWALPGGFLNCQLETLEQCGSREVFEEMLVAVAPDQLRLVDVRSNPRRDSRQHVVDHGFVWFVPAERQNEVLASMHAQSDAEFLEFVDTEWLLQQEIAFDHRLIIERALALA